MDLADATVMKAARRYRVEFVPVRHLEDARRLADDYSDGPSMGCGVSIAQRTVFCYDDYYEIPPAHLLHETVHAVLGEQGMKTDEAYLLMPFEWILARELGRPLSSRRRADFMKHVRDYQEGTSLGQDYWCQLSDYGPHVRRTRWWQNGVRRAQHVGLLDEHRRVTWRDPDWSKVRLPKSMWDPSDEYENEDDCPLPLKFRSAR